MNIHNILSLGNFSGAGQGYNRGGWRGRPRGRGRGFVPRNKNTLKFDKDYDFEQANTEFEELRSQLAKTKISDGEAKVEVRFYILYLSKLVFFSSVYLINNDIHIKWTKS